MEENVKKTSSERVSEMLHYSINAHLASSKAEFAALLDITPETLSRFLSGKREPPANSWRAFNAKLGKAFNEDWLLTGQGEMMSQHLTSFDMPSSPSTIDMLILEMRESRKAKDDQIDRLLTIIERMHNGHE